MFLEQRHKVEIHRMTSRVAECPIDEMSRPRGAKDAQLRIPPTEPEMAPSVDSADLHIDLHLECRRVAGETLADMVETRSAFRCR
ncbi:hypothetical protein ACWD5R_32830 [Streptomyces sp. NPDC002514]|uniref:hypothetical protein n=1 Tax=Streptomyces sp. NPDC001270 TaxID=3364554 RepID=UPI00368E1C59